MSRLISYTATPSSGYTEPVLLADMKLYLRVDFADDDDLITALITSARMKCEKILGLVLVDTDIKAVYRCSRNHVHGNLDPVRTYEIFYGPVLSESGVPAFTGLPDDAKIIGEGIGIWIESYSDELDISYSSGWDAVPDWAILGIKKQVAWDYEHRGDEAAANIAPETAIMLRPYSVNLSDILL